MKVRVLVQLKAEVSDPEGNAIREALATLGGGAVKDVRVGKLFDLDLETEDEALGREQLERIARDVLSNPVIEDYDVEILSGDPA